MPESYEMLEAGYDLEKDQLTIKFEGIKHELLPKVPEREGVYRQKIDNTPTGRLM